MRLPTFIAASLSLTASLAAQQYDAAGNDPAFAGGPGSTAPGSVLSAIIGPVGPGSDLCHDGENLLMVSGYDGGGLIYHIKESTGTVAATTAIGTTFDFGLAWDDRRERFITTDPSADVVQAWSRTGALLATFPFPNTGMVGAGWDCMRDVYWVCDWQSETVFAINPVTGAAGFSFSVGAAGCSRPAGLAFDPVADLIYVGGRDASTIFAFNPVTGALVCSFGAQDGGNNPQGCGMSLRGGVWHSSWNSAGLYELEGCTPIHPRLLITPNFPVAGGPISLSMTGLAPGQNAAIGFSTAGCGPIPSPLGPLLLSPPANLLAIVPANGSGTSTMTGMLPPVLAGMTVYLHGGNLSTGQRCNNAILRP